MDTSATFIQKLIRLYLARCLSKRMRHDQAASSIQSFYKRIKSDIRRREIKMNLSCVKIQKEARRRSAQKCIVQLSKEYTIASIRIQSCWRGHLARLIRSKILIERYNLDVSHRILRLNSEISHYKNKLEQLLARSRNDEISHEITKSKDAIFEVRSNLRNSQHNFSELLKMKAQRTPASVAEGWEEQINQSLQFERKMLTTIKLDLVLKRGKELKVSERMLNQSCDAQNSIKQKICDLEKNRRSLINRQQELRRDQLKREASIKFRKAVADEKRRWQVDHRTPSGKPLKSKKNAILPSQFCSGSVNIFANEEDSNKPTYKLVKMIELQSYMGQLSHLRGMVKPLDASSLSNEK